MANTVFILGAGASAHAQAPLTKDFFKKAVDLIQGDKLDDEDKGYFNMIQEVYLNKIRQIATNFTFDLKNIETIFSLIEMAKLTGKFLDYSIDDINNLRIAMNKFIVRTLEITTYFDVRDGNIISPSDYKWFYQHIILKMMNSHPRMSFCVISFNYDLALDYVLEFNDGPKFINYCLDRQRPSGNAVKLIKLHGSLNWATCSKKSCKRIRVISLRDDIGLRGTSINISKEMHKFRCECGATLNELPLIVPPTWNKTANYNIENVWSQAVEEMSDAKNIFVVGYSMPKADLFFQYFLALGTLNIANLERFWVFDIDPEIKNKWNDFLEQDMKRTFKFIKDDFNNAINLITKELF